MKRIFGVFMMVVAMSTLMSGCVSPDTAGLGVSGQVINDELSAALECADAKMTNFIRVTNVATETMANGLMRVQVELQVMQKHDLVVQTKFKWFDANGMEIDTASRPWILKTFHGGEVVNVTGIAPSEAATGFKFAVRPVN